MGRGRGKVILLGEHSVVYGKPALAAGLAKGVTASAEPSPAFILECQPWDVRVEPTSDEQLGRAFAAVLAGYDSPSPVHVRADVELPGGAGLGCSAALGVAVVDALDELYGVERTPEERAEFSLAWERVFHGNPSGVDNTMAACGGIAVFTKGEPLERVRPRAPLPLVIAHSGESSSTKEVVDHVRRQYEKEPERIGEVFDAIEALVRNAKLAVEAGDLKGLGQLMDMNQAMLSATDDLHREARDPVSQRARSRSARREAHRGRRRRLHDRARAEHRRRTHDRGRAEGARRLAHVDRGGRMSTGRHRFSLERARTSRWPSTGARAT